MRSSPFCQLELSQQDWEALLQHFTFLSATTGLSNPFILPTGGLDTVAEKGWTADSVCHAQAEDVGLQHGVKLSPLSVERSVSAVTAWDSGSGWQGGGMRLSLAFSQ